MATTFSFAGKEIKQPGTYAQIKSAITNPPQALDYGKILIIDTGSGATFGASGGINGELKSGKDAIVEYSSLRAFRDAIGGGIWYRLAEYMFLPNGTGGIGGASSLQYIRAALTTAATIDYTFAGGGAAGGTLEISCRDEGIIGNGVETGSKLVKGFAGVMEAGKKDTAKFVLKFYRGTFAGLDAEGDPFGSPEEQTTPELLATSPEFDDIQTIIDWTATSSAFNKRLKLTANTVVGLGTVDAADLAANTGNNLAAGGAETFSTTALDDVLDVIAQLDNTYILSDQFGIDAGSADNFKILLHLEDESRYIKFLVIGGGLDADEFNGTATDSVDVAIAFDNEKVVLVHGGIRVANRFVGEGFKEYDALYHAAFVAGRHAGLPRQAPLSFKGLGYDGLLHELSTIEQDIALDNGVLFSKFDPEIGQIIVNQGINTLQANEFLVNDDGTSHEWSIMAIAAQLHREILIFSKRDLLVKESGPNRGNPSPADVTSWLEGYLLRKVNEGLILSFDPNITIEIQSDAYFINFGFEPNFPINKLFFTGFILDFSTL